MEGKKQRLGMILALYLLGLFFGALNNGTITPARTIIQDSLGVDPNTGIWMINIFTLAYAVVIPIAGKLADRYGRKRIYLVSMALFTIGSLIAGLSSSMGSFAILIAGRVVQALGAGGIMPIATAEFGTSFPEEKRGMALGMVGAVFGIAGVLGAAAGSMILGLFGADQWHWIFFINVPIGIIVIIGSIFFIPNNKGVVKGPIDKLGAVFMSIIILALLYGLKNLNFFDFVNSLKLTSVYPFLIIVIIFIPIFILVEKRAKDPIFHIEYMGNRKIVITLIMSFCTGASSMGMVFIPELAETAMGLTPGSGGYYVVIVGVLTAVMAPVSGAGIDKLGPKPILYAGFGVSVLGCLWLALIFTAHVHVVHLVIALALIGAGMGLTMGAPLNYVMLANTAEEDSNSALATLSLVRSIGTSVAPAILIGFATAAAAANTVTSIGSPDLTGFRNMFVFLGALNLVAAILLCFYGKYKSTPKAEA
ncbi:MAG: MFS transporter [Firmicutes bacterium]|nr:MFS transporter [Bacillota bacterium]